MKVKILVEFDVPGTDDETVAKSAASMAAHEWLWFSTESDECEVHVDGHGEFLVKLGLDHE